MEHESKLRLEFGKDTEKLIQDVLKNLTVEQLDAIDLRREYDKSTDFAGEPLTIAAVVTISIGVTVAVTRLIERWMEKHRQIEQFRIIAEVYKDSTEAGAALT